MGSRRRCPPQAAAVCGCHCQLSALGFGSAAAAAACTHPWIPHGQPKLGSQLLVSPPYAAASAQLLSYEDGTHSPAAAAAACIPRWQLVACRRSSGHGATCASWHMWHGAGRLRLQPHPQHTPQRCVVGHRTVGQAPSLLEHLGVCIGRGFVPPAGPTGLDWMLLSFPLPCCGVVACASPCSQH